MAPYTEEEEKNQALALRYHNDIAGTFEPDFWMTDNVI
jgi:hypothetical protein